MTRTQQDKEKRKAKEAEAREKERRLRLKEAEDAVANAEKEADRLEQILADPSIWNDAGKAAELTKQYQRQKEEIARLYEAWEALEAE